VELVKQRSVLLWLVMQSEAISGASIPKPFVGGVSQTTKSKYSDKDRRFLQLGNNVISQVIAERSAISNSAFSRRPVWYQTRSGSTRIAAKLQFFVFFFLNGSDFFKKTGNPIR
jgi:hypothetical protein